MKERILEHYFLAVRMGILLLLEIYIVLSGSILTGASYEVLLLLALLVGTVAGAELTIGIKRWIFFAGAVLMWFILFCNAGSAFWLLGIFLCYEGISYLELSLLWYFFPLLLSFYASDAGVGMQIMITVFLAVIYAQHDFVVDAYRRRTKEDVMEEQRLKHNMSIRENEMQEEMKRNLVQAENHLLEEREDLYQTLHDKLGHNINGSVYQLEAVKVLMETEPEVCKSRIQAVIDQLRTGMDEIRSIIRKERPQKYKLAMMQLDNLCKDCREKGIMANLITEGDMSEVPDHYLEVILDNAYEAVSNSLKYAKCTKIEIRIHVMNRMIRCSISDNGVGCTKMMDGMGIAGMRKRMREINGILDFETEAGFTINMLLPR